jgi:hypothetical protein
LDAKQLVQREVVYLDIVNDHVDPSHYSDETDPTKFKSITGRGLLEPDWKVIPGEEGGLHLTKDPCSSVSFFTQDKSQPLMCCYKLVTVKFKVFGFETSVQNYIAKVGSRGLAWENILLDP